MPADSVNFVDEDDAGGILLALLEKIADAAGADADKHFHKVGTGNREEGDVRFAGDSAGQKGFARAWRPNQQHALGNAATEFLEFLRIFQKFDNFLEFFLGFIGSRDIFESSFFLLRRKQTRARLSEAERLISTGLHLAHQKEAEPDEEEERETVEKEQNPVGTSYFFDLNLHRLVTQFFGDGGGVFFGNGYLELAVGGPDVLALQVVTDLTEIRSEEHTSELQSHSDLVCRLLLEKKKQNQPV